MTPINAPATMRPPRDGESWDTWIDRHKAQPVTMKMIGELVNQMTANFKAMNAANIIRNEKIAGLEAKIRELEARPTGAKYCGVWQDGLTYQRDDAVTKGGSLWIAKHNHVKSEPGVDHVSWQLAVQRGRDGRSTR